jgi:hypothetical protein
MSTALDVDPRIGSTTPRMFTPPLPEHVDPEAEYGIRPEATWGPLCCYFLEMILGWHLLPWQKWLYYRALEKQTDNTGFRFRILIVMVGRQQGKTKWGRGLGLWRLFMDERGRGSKHWPAAKLAVVAAQNLEYAESTLKDCVDEMRDHPLLAPELLNHAVTNGKHRAILTYRRLWRAVTANSSGGRSLPVDFAWLDELRTHSTWDAYRAIEPTTTVRPCSQLLVTSNAGDNRSIVLRSLRETAMRAIVTRNTERTRTGFFEWSVPDDVDPRKPEYWHLAQPALGLLNEFCMDDLMGKFEAMEAGDMPGFQTEYLCQWVDSLDPGIIPAQAWADTKDKDSERDKANPAYICVDVNYHRTRAYIAMAALRADGKIHAEVLKTPVTGTEWVPAWLAERKANFAGLCVQKTGAPASSMIEDLRAAGLDVVEWGAPVAQLASGAGEFYDGIVNGTIRHRPSAILDRAAASTIARTSGDAWFFSRRNSPVDAAPLVAVAGAVWLLNNPPPTPGPPTIWEWPDEETLDTWRKEADERFS